MSANSATAQGPWGGSGGHPFYDGRGDVVEIDVTYTNDHVTKLQVAYAESTGSRWHSPTHGSHGGHDEKITLDYPEEYLTQVVGTYGRCVNSISFITNKGTYGPFGNTEGEGFESPADVVIVGFFGRSGSIIDQLGVLTIEASVDNVQLDKPLKSTVITQGQWGGHGGYDFCDGRGDVVEITVKYDDECVHLLQAEYQHSGDRFSGACHGEGEEGEEAKVSLNFPTERLMQVKGTYDPRGYLTSISLITNNETYGPFGNSRGQHFQSLPHGVLGFCGRSGRVVDQLGVLTYVENPWNSHLGKKPARLEISTVVNGPWGGSGGQDFYDGRGDVVEILVNFSKVAVTTLQVTYEQCGTRFEGAPHGGAGGDSWKSQIGIGKNLGEESSKLCLEFPEEFLLQVKGTYGPIPSRTSDAVTSLTFVTNKQTYGPYGVPSGQEFETPATGVVGFFGKAGARLDQLGVFTKFSESAE